MGTCVTSSVVLVKEAARRIKAGINYNQVDTKTASRRAILSGNKQKTTRKKQKKNH